MRSKALCFTVLLSVLALCGAAHALNVSGTITTTTWTKANSPYRVTGAITVPTGNTLTIEPGVDVLFDSDVKFIVQGKLYAVGITGNGIRFVKGAASEWGGLRFSGTDSSTLAYVRISDGRANGLAAGDSSGGAISAVGTVMAGPKLGIFYTIIAGNSSVAYGGGLYVSNGAKAFLRYCTLYGNVSSVGLSGAVHNELASTYLTGCIVWANSPYAGYRGMGTLSFAYSAVQGSLPSGSTDAGGNLINADPLFVNAAGGDYHIGSTSPCKNTGDPTSPFDPDGTRADMGALFYDTRPPASLSMPSVVVRRNDVFSFPITATTVGAYNVDLSFTIDTSVIAPQGDFIVSSAFDGIPNAIREGPTVNGTTVRVSFISSTPVVLTNGTLVTLAFTVKTTAPMGASAVTWDAAFTNVNEVPATLAGGTVTVVLPYGDVTEDGVISALDASAILRYVVGITLSIPFELADVTDNGKVTGFDAAWVLIRALNPGRLFPCEGGERLPGTKPATGGAVALEWVPTVEGWALLAADATGVLAGDMVLTLADDTSVTLAGDGLSAYRQDGRTLYVSFVRGTGAGDELLSFVMDSAVPPVVASASFNENDIRGSLFPPAVPFTLSQNTPNPFNPSTTLRFSLPEKGHVTLAVYDVTGALTRTLAAGRFEAGQHAVIWDGRDSNGREVASGVYLARLTAAHGVVTRRMVLAR